MKNNDIQYIIDKSINAVLPDKSVLESLQNLKLSGNLHVIAIGKAA